jgi:hypothetical protein
MVSPFYFLDERSIGIQRPKAKALTALRCSAVSSGASITVARRPSPVVRTRTNVVFIAESVFIVFTADFSLPSVMRARLTNVKPITVANVWNRKAYLVAQRTREIGLRMALGAQRGDVMGWILRRGLALSSAGLVIGLAASALLTRYLQKMLYHVEAFDPLTLAAVIGLLLAVSVTASALPAHRASRVDPMNTLREQ